MLPDDKKNHNSMFSHSNSENKCSSNLLILTLLLFKSLMSHKNSCQNTMNGWISISSTTVFNLLIHTHQKSRTTAMRWKFECTVHVDKFTAPFQNVRIIWPLVFSGIWIQVGARKFKTSNLRAMPEGHCFVCF